MFHTGRPFNKSYPLGQIMAEEMITVNQLAAKANVSHRKISDYLANRVPYVPSHLIRLSEVLDCDPEDLIPDEPSMRENRKMGAYG